MISSLTTEIQLLDDSGSKCIAQPFKRAYKNIAISANGSIFAAVTKDRMGIEIWDAESEKFLPSRTGASGAIYSIALSATGERFIIGLDDSTAEVWESRTGRLLKRLKQERIYYKDCTDIAISCDGEQFAWTGHDDDRNTHFYTEKSHLIVPDEFQHYLNSGSKLAFSPNGKRLVAVRNWRGAFWDVATGTCLRRFNHADRSTWLLDTSFINFDFSIAVDSQEYKECEDYLAKYYITPDGAWIMRHGEKLLWILPEYRPKDAIAFGSKIVIQRASGPPFIIELLDEGL